MAKAKYNPLSAFREDPLAALKHATDTARSIEPFKQVNSGGPENSNAFSSTRDEQNSSSSDQTTSKRQITGKSSAAVKPLSASLQTSRNTVYLYPEDLTKLRQLSGYVSTEHGIRANDSMIVRAALSLLEADVRLLHALRETELLDRRRRANRSES